MVTRHLHSDDGNSKCNFLKFTGDAKTGSQMSRIIARACPKGRVDFPLAGFDAVPSEHRDGDHRTDEADVQDHGHEREECHSSNAAGEDGAEQSIERGRTGYTLDGPHPLRNRLFIVG